MSQGDKDFRHAADHLYGHCTDVWLQANAFADGAAYARKQVAERLRTALEFQRKKYEVDRHFAPSTTEVLEELIAELEKGT
jgi:hypothetical protein